MRTYIMRDCADWPRERRRPSPAALFWIGYLIGIAGSVVGFVLW